MSQKITETLMSNPDTLDLFTEEQKKRFIQSTVAAIVKDEDATEMIQDNIKNYLFTDVNYKIRTEFNYDFELSMYLPKGYNILSNCDDYFYVQEKLFYKVKYLSEESNGAIGNDFSIGFVFDNKNLDNAFRDKKIDAELENCIFRESLDLKKEDVQYFLSLQKAELLEQFRSLFKLDVQIDNSAGEIHDVVINENAMIVKLHAQHKLDVQEHTVRIIFHMPKRWDSILEVAIVYPTKAPKISVSYPEDTMNVEMFSFLSKGEESSVEVAHEHKNGIYDISLNNEWIYPISGMVFTVNKME